MAASYEEVYMQILGTYSIVVTIVGIMAVVAIWKVFEKAGHAGWKALIPFYGSYTLFDIVFGNGWKFLLLFVPCVNIIFGIMLMLKLAKVFGKETSFGIGLIFLPTIFLLILAFGSAEYVGVE